ncbi:MAG: flagellar basal body-associated FliL family protein [Desulfomonilia bacterium]
MATENAEVKEESGKKKKSPLMLIVILIVFVLLIGGAAAGYFMVLAPMMQGSGSGVAQTGVVVPQTQAISPGVGLAGPMKQLESFIVNLTDAQGTRYLKVVMQLELSNALLEPEIEKRKPQIRDEIIMLLSSKSFDDVSSVAGKRALKRAIINGVNKYLATGQVVQIYFTEFVVQ